MLKLPVAGQELYDEDKNEFIQTKSTVLQLGHSLVSVAKWEAIWNKPFLSKEDRTDEETLSYIRCMTITQNVPSDVYLRLNASHIEKINNYIDSPMTATTINRQKKNTSREVITAEIIYYSMIALNIPFECQKWHLNRLLTLIDVCNIKSQPQKKMGRSELLNRNRELNRQRREKLNTKG